MDILGIDPGSRFTGYGVVRRRGSSITALAEGRIRVPTDLPVSLRLARLTEELEQVLDQHSPDLVAVESLFHGLNSRSLIVLAQARGAILGTLGRRGLEAVEYSPAEIKTAVTGNGRADKRQVARMVALLLGLSAHHRTTDATDALALALCCAQRSRLDALDPRRSRTARTGESGPRPTAEEVARGS